MSAHMCTHTGVPSYARWLRCAALGVLARWCGHAHESPIIAHRIDSGRVSTWFAGRRRRTRRTRTNMWFRAFQRVEFARVLPGLVQPARERAPPPAAWTRTMNRLCCAINRLFAKTLATQSAQACTYCRASQSSPRRRFYRRYQCSRVTVRVPATEQAPSKRSAPTNVTMETFDETVWPSPSECLPVDCPFDVLPVDIVTEVLDALAAGATHVDLCAALRKSESRHPTFYVRGWGR
jgi:hypothetical protein